MKKMLLAVATSAAMLSGTAVAADVDGALDFVKKDAYVKGTVGFADFGLDDSALAITGTYGKRLEHFYPGFSAEVDLSFSLTDAESSYSGSMGSGEVTGSYVSLGGYGVYEYPLDNVVKNLSAYGRAGLVYTSVDVETSVTVGNMSSSSSMSDSSIGLGLGGGAKYQYSKQLSFVADFTMADDIDLFTVGTRYEF